MGLKGLYMEAFNDHVNETLYNQTGSPLEASIIEIKSGQKPIDQISQAEIDGNANFFNGLISIPGVLASTIKIDMPWGF